MRLFNAGLVDRFMVTAGMEDDQPIESKMVTNSIQKAQGAVEAQNYEIRKNVLKYDDVMNRQRQVIYEERRAVLAGPDLHEQLRMFVNDVVGGYVDAATAEGFAADWDLEQLWEALRQVYPVGITIEELEDLAGGRKAISAELLREQLMSDAHHAYDQREDALGDDTMREVERRVVLSVLDRKWREHLYEMDYLQEGIGLRAMAQRDPLIEYQREGFQLFEAMMDAIKEESVSHLFSVQVEVNPPAQPVGAAPMAVCDLVGGVAGRRRLSRPRGADVTAPRVPADSGGRGCQRRGAAGVGWGEGLGRRPGGNGAAVVRTALHRPRRGRPGRRDRRQQTVERRGGPSRQEGEAEAALSTSVGGERARPHRRTDPPGCGWQLAPRAGSLTSAWR